MPSVLVDSCVWIDYAKNLRSRETDLLDNLLEVNEALLCGVVETELRTGIRSAEASHWEKIFSNAEYLEAERGDYRLAGRLLNEMKAKGRQLSLADGLIASLCLRRKLALLTTDKDFRAIPSLKFY